MGVTKVLVADGQRLFAEALAIALAHRPHFDVLDLHPVNGVRVFQRALEHKPDVVVVDQWMPGICGPALAALMSHRKLSTKVILTTWFWSTSDVESAIAAGAAGLLPKSSTVAEVAAMTEGVAAGGPPAGAGELRPEVKAIGIKRSLDAAGGREVQDHDRFARLTVRELEILQNLDFGFSREEIAERFSMSPSTVRNHIRSVLSKSGTRTHTEALAAARRLGYVSSPVVPPQAEARSPYPRPERAEIVDDGPPRICVLVSDAQRLFADALAESLALHPAIAVLPERPSTPAELLEVLSRRRADIVLCDLWMDGIALAKNMSNTRSGCKVILLSWLHAPRHVREALSAGAVGFLTKGSGVAVVANAVLRAGRGESLVFGSGLAGLLEVIRSRMKESAPALAGLGALTRRETEILVHLAAGLSIDEVATRLSVVPGTVKSHVHSILKKTNTRTHAEAVAMLLGYGRIIVPDSQAALASWSTTTER